MSWMREAGRFGQSGWKVASLMQRIALTVPRDIEAFLNQTIDRFSIGWYWTAADMFRVWK